MSDNSRIEWTQRTWNPTTGCDRVSDGCDHCYALTMAKRLKGMGNPKYQTDGDPRTSGPGFGVRVHPDTLGQPLRWRRPSLVFVNSMSDLFHEGVPDEYIAQVFATMAVTPRHTYQVLTKRHGRMKSLVRSFALRDGVQRLAGFPEGTMPWPLPNVWLGVSVEDQKWADIRIPALLATPAAVRFLSCEPLLGRVSLRGSWHDYLAGWATESEHAPNCDCAGRSTTCPVPVQVQTARVEWVIVGGESGPKARPMAAEWAEQIRDDCEASGTAFFMKQAGAVLAREWGCTDRKGHNPDEWPAVFPRQMPVHPALQTPRRSASH